MSGSSELACRPNAIRTMSGRRGRCSQPVQRVDRIDVLDDALAVHHPHGQHPRVRRGPPDQPGDERPVSPVRARGVRPAGRVVRRQRPRASCPGRRSWTRNEGALLQPARAAALRYPAPRPPDAGRIPSRAGRPAAPRAGTAPSPSRARSSSLRPRRTRPGPACQRWSACPPAPWAQPGRSAWADRTAASMAYGSTPPCTGTLIRVACSPGEPSGGSPSGLPELGVRQGARSAGRCPPAGTQRRGPAHGPSGSSWSSVPSLSRRTACAAAKR